MSRDTFIPKAFDFLVAAIAFSTPLHPRIVPVLIILLGACWIIEGNFNTKLRQMQKNPVAMLPALLYLLYLAGMLYSTNQQFGWRDLETKLTLLLFPLFLPVVATYSNEQFRKIMRWFVAGCVLGCIMSFGWAVYSFFLERYHVEQGIVRAAYISTDFFFGSRLSVFLHPSYFAMYLCFAMVLLVRWLLLGRAAGMKSRLLMLLAIVVFSIMIFLLASKLGMILLVLIWTGAAGWIMIRKKKVIAGFIVIAIFALGSVLLYKFSAIVASRIDYTIEALTTPVVDKTSTESSTVRRLIWEQAKEVIAQNPVGAGTGDSKDALMEKYKEEGLTGAYSKNLNAHNQYLQTAVAIGWGGLAVLVAAMLGLLTKGIRTKDTEAWALALILIISFVTESMLETQAGVIFFSFFVTLFAYRTQFREDGRV